MVEIPTELKFYLPGQVNPVSLELENPLTRILDLSVEPGVVRSEPLNKGIRDYTSGPVCQFERVDLDSNR